MDAFEVVEAFDVTTQLAVELGVVGEAVLMYHSAFRTWKKISMWALS